MRFAQTIEWVPVIERLPKDEERVFIGTDDGRVHLGFVRGGQWLFAQGSWANNPIPLRSVASFWAPRILHPRDIPPEENAETELLLVRAEMAAVERLHEAQNEVVRRKSQTIAALEAEIAALKAEVNSLP